MNLEELRGRVDAGDIDTVLLAICDMQGRLQGKRLTARHFLAQVAEHGAEGCNYLLAVDVDMNPVDGYAMASWERGYGDFVMRPDISTLRPVPWQEGTAMVLCDLTWEDGSDVVASPRQILRRQLGRLAERGWGAYAGTELELMVFRETYESAWHKAYRGLEPANLYNVDYSLLGTARVEPLIRRIRNAWRRPGCSSRTPRASATSASTRSTSTTPRRCGPPTSTWSTRTPPRRSPPRTGMAHHLHGQVRRARGQFVPHPLLAARRGRGRCSRDDIARRHVSNPSSPASSPRLRELTLLLAPNINSYKRYAAGSLRPDRGRVGPDNRTCALRVVGHGQWPALREPRPAADLNPYLALRAMVAAGLHGRRAEARS